MDLFERFKRDVPYDLLVPPQGINYEAMDPETAKEAFDWFLAHKEERIAYMRKRCAKDLHIPIRWLDFSDDSLIEVWAWFLRTARTEPTPDALREAMQPGAKLFGPSYIPERVITVATHFIIRDVAMYMGESYIHNYPFLSWSYIQKPKDDVMINQPAIFGFTNNRKFAPIFMVHNQAAKIYTGITTDKDLFNVYKIWERHLS